MNSNAMAVNLKIHNLNNHVTLYSSTPFLYKTLTVLMIKYLLRL